ncbi:LIC_13387 family protein [Bdellovibrio sp. HCB337]|uniref:LIC_13387 family protein n=1 Tax=Bdellovibrio sp. HCB337 TaxID=3394358 RepID=UPI0039A76C5C
MIASCLNIAVAIGHTVGFIRMMGKDQDLIGSAVWGMMQKYQPMEASKHSLYDFYVGDSLSVGLSYLTLGALGVFIARHFKSQNLPIPRPMAAVATMSSLAALGLAITFFPVPPIAFLVVISLCFALSMF